MNKTFGRVVRVIGIALVALAVYPAHAQLMLPTKVIIRGTVRLKTATFL